jgi:hypothetical protein
MRQALSVATLCVSRRADDRPAMKDVVALLKEIRRPASGGGDDDTKPQPLPQQPAAAAGAPVSPARGAHSRGQSSSCSFAVSEYSA